MRDSRKRSFAGASVPLLGIRRCWPRERPHDGLAVIASLRRLLIKIDPVKEPQSSAFERVGDTGSDPAAVQQPGPYFAHTGSFTIC